MKTNTVGLTIESNLQYALQYASIGWQVLPLHYIEKKNAVVVVCNVNHLVSTPILGGGFKAATLRKDIIEKWWTETP